MAQLSLAGIDLIVANEGFSTTPYWPKGASGVTIGFGYDVGYVSRDEFISDWGAHFSPADLAALLACVHLTGAAAQAALGAVKTIKVGKAFARSVFIDRSMPKAETRASQAFPRISELADNAYSALVSLVFNRGGSMQDQPGDALKRRKEMRDIRDALASNTLSMQQKLKSIAASLRSMKRIWAGQGLAGLISRREEEAKLVETCL